MVVGGERVKRGELPWHAGIYRKNVTSYEQICGGSLISKRVVISAAHCFWTDLEKQLPASQFAVAVGKLYRPWDDTVDQAQKSDVIILITSRPGIHHASCMLKNAVIKAFH
ncbi:Hemolymph protein 14 [Operophtera brumata]|uniref:Hemolymph protein 14 n=1 Tax=Operophtera brumata TaxID=104452 RepID=A0A0L7KZV2_OPEBR|nr:Hemolymph protein 14 [Operophtera brumata]